MSEIPAAIAAQMAIARQNAAMAMIKQNADIQQQIVALVDQAVDNVPVSPARGGNVNFRA